MGGFSKVYVYSFLGVLFALIVLGIAFLLWPPPVSGTNEITLPDGTNFSFETIGLALIGVALAVFLGGFVAILYYAFRPTHEESSGQGNTEAKKPISEQDQLRITLYREMVQLFVTAKEFLQKDERNRDMRKKLIDGSSDVYASFDELCDHVADVSKTSPQLFKPLPEKREIENICAEFSKAFKPLDPTISEREKILEIDKHQNALRQAVKSFEEKVTAGTLEPTLLEMQKDSLTPSGQKLLRKLLAQAEN